jgi:hypothetical protein
MCYISITVATLLMLFREVIVVYSEDHTEHIDSVCGQNVDWLLEQVVPQCSTTVLQTVENVIFKLSMHR